MRYLLTLDVGTTAVKAGLFNENLESVSFAIKEYTLLTPRTDFVELEPDTYWEMMKEAIYEVQLASKINPSDIIAITCTTQGETLIPIGSDGNHLSNAIVWLDSRAKAEANFISDNFDNVDIYKTTGLPELNGFCPIAKILWIKNNTPEIYSATEKFLLLEDYFVYRMSGKFVTNPSLICSTGYFDINKDTLWNEVLDFCEISYKKFPAIYSSGKVVGKIQPSIAAELNLSADVMITTGAMDQVASAIGSGNTAVGVVAETTGTAQVVAATSDKSLAEKWSPVTIYRHAVDEKFLKIVINQTAGIAYKWFRNEFCIDLLNSSENTFDEMGKIAENEPVASRGLTFFPHLTGMQFPKSDESLRGVFFGVGLDTNRGCFIRAIMEGVGYMLRESIEEMNLSPDSIISLGGGAKSDLWCQIKADICGTKISVLENVESTSLGAAILGFIAMGILSDFGEANHQIALQKVYTPKSENYELYKPAYLEYKQMYNAFSPIFKKRRN